MRKWRYTQLTLEGCTQVVRRMQARKKTEIKVINSNFFHEFVQRVLKSKITESLKLFITLQLSTGSRVSELLAIKKSDIIYNEQGIPALRIRCLKKGKEVYRLGAVHPSVIKLLRKLLDGLSDTDRLFTYSRKTIWLHYQNILGMTPHSMRHSWVIFLFEQKKFRIEEVVNELQFSNWTMALRYYNTVMDKNAYTMF